MHHTLSAIVCILTEKNRWNRGTHSAYIIFLVPPFHILFYSPEFHSPILQIFQHVSLLCWLIRKVELLHETTFKYFRLEWKDIPGKEASDKIHYFFKAFVVPWERTWTSWDPSPSLKYISSQTYILWLDFVWLQWLKPVPLWHTVD